MAKHVITIQAQFVVPKDSPYYLVVKQQKNGVYNLILYEKTSSIERKKAS